MQELPPYELSPDLVQVLIDVAATSDVLLFGELHGTQEVPQLLVRLLDDLAAVGYRGLALEIPRDERNALDHGQEQKAPQCRSSLRTLSLMVVETNKCSLSFVRYLPLTAIGICSALIKDTINP